MNCRRCSGKDVRFIARPRTEPYVRLSRVTAPTSGVLTARSAPSTLQRVCHASEPAAPWVRYVLCWCRLPSWPPPFAPHPSSAASPPQAPPQWRFLRFVRRLHCYHDAGTLDFVVSVHGLASAPRLPRCGRAVHAARRRAAASTRMSLRPRCDLPFARDAALDRGRASAPRLGFGAAHVASADGSFRPLDV